MKKKKLFNRIGIMLLVSSLVGFGIIGVAGDEDVSTAYPVDYPVDHPVDDEVTVILEEYEYAEWTEFDYYDLESTIGNMKNIYYVPGEMSILALEKPDEFAEFFVRGRIRKTSARRKYHFGGRLDNHNDIAWISKYLNNTNINDMNMESKDKEGKILFRVIIYRAGMTDEEVIDVLKSLEVSIFFWTRIDGVWEERMVKTTLANVAPRKIEETSTK